MIEEINQALQRLTDFHSVDVPVGLIADLLRDCVDEHGEVEPSALAIARLVNDKY